MKKKAVRTIAKLAIVLCILIFIFALWKIGFALVGDHLCGSYVRSECVHNTIVGADYEEAEQSCIETCRFSGYEKYAFYELGEKNYICPCCPGNEVCSFFSPGLKDLD